MRSDTPIFLSMVQQHERLLDLRSRLTEVPAHQFRPFPFLYDIPAASAPKKAAAYEVGHAKDNHFNPRWVPDVRGKASR